MNRAKLERLGRLIPSLCRIDQWLQRNPKVPDSAMTPPGAPEGLPEGVNPSEVKDPVARKAYADAEAKATLMAKIIDDRYDVEFLYKSELDYTYLFVNTAIP